MGSVNDFIRGRIREIRKANGLTLREVASQANVSAGSLSALERGVYRFCPDTLFQVLGVLQASILDVWPVTHPAEVPLEATRQKRMNEFRLAEIVRFSRAEGGALFRTRDDEVELLLRWGLSDGLVERLAFYQPRGIEPPLGGRFFESRKSGDHLRVYLQSGSYGKEVETLIQLYLKLWHSVF